MSDARERILKYLHETNLINSAQFQEGIKNLHQPPDADSNLQKLQKFASEEFLPYEAEEKLKASGSKFGKYIQIELLGTGGSGEVYKAFDQELKRYVALKLYRDVRANRTHDFKREAEIIAGLEHPNIIPIYESGTFNKQDYIATKYIEGDPLDSLTGYLNQKEVAALAIQICRALEHSHSKGVIHRDIKPNNIFITKEGHVYLLDFGIAKEADSFLTITGELRGTPEYMSPEQISGKNVDEKSDIYSLGISLYQSLSGMNPYTGKTPAEVLANILNKELPYLLTVDKTISKDLANIIQKCVYKDPRFRYQSAKELREDLERYLNGDTVKASSHTLVIKMYQLIKKRRVIIGFSVLIGSVMIMLYLINTASQKNNKKREKAIPYFEEGKRISLIMANSSSIPGEQLSALIDSGIKELSAAINIDNSFTEAYMLRSELYANLGNIINAKQDATTIIDKFPNYKEAYYKRIIYNFSKYILDRDMLSETTELLDDLIAECKEDLIKLEELKASYEMLMCARGVIHILTGKYSEARQTLDRVIDFGLIKSDAILLRAYSGFYDLESVSSKGLPPSQVIKNVLKDMDSATVIHANNMDLYKNCVYLCMLLNDYAQGLRYLSTARKMTTDKIIFTIAEAEFQLYFSKTEAALELVNSIKEEDIEKLSPRAQSMLLLNRGKLKARLGKSEEADRDFEKAIEAAPAKLKKYISETIEKLKRN